MGGTDGYYLCGRFQPILFKTYEKVFYCCLDGRVCFLSYIVLL